MRYGACEGDLSGGYLFPQPQASDNVLGHVSHSVSLGTIFDDERKPCSWPGRAVRWVKLEWPVGEWPFVIRREIRRKPLIA